MQNEIHIQNQQKHIQAVLEYQDKHPVKYSAIRKFARDNWADMVRRAEGPQAVSIADQIAVFTECPQPVADDIARDMALAKSIGIEI